MTRLSDLVAKEVLSRSSAERLGQIVHVAIVADRPSIEALVVKSGRRSGLVHWSDVVSVGPDAVIVVDEAALHGPADDHEKRVAAGATDPLGKRVLADTGNQIGTVDDVEVDSSQGSVEAVIVAGEPIAGPRLLGAGSYAVVVAARA